MGFKTIRPETGDQFGAGRMADSSRVIAPKGRPALTLQAKRVTFGRAVPSRVPRISVSDTTLASRMKIRIGQPAVDRGRYAAARIQSASDQEGPARLAQKSLGSNRAEQHPQRTRQNNTSPTETLLCSADPGRNARITPTQSDRSSSPWPRRRQNHSQTLPDCRPEHRPLRRHAGRSWSQKPDQHGSPSIGLFQCSAPQ